MFVGGVYARVRRMKTEALKGQIWQEPYLVAYWFWRGQDCFSDYLGNYFLDYFRTTFRTFSDYA